MAEMGYNAQRDGSWPARDHIPPILRLLEHWSRADENIDGLPQLSRQLERLNLWNRGFDAKGGSDPIIIESQQLRETILMLLSAMGNALVTMTKVLLPEASQRSHHGLSNSCDRLSRLKKGLSKAITEECLRKDNDDDLNDSDNSDGSDDSLVSKLPLETPSSTRLEELVEEVGYYCNLLNDLTPTIRESGLATYHDDAKVGQQPTSKQANFSLRVPSKSWLRILDRKQNGKLDMILGFGILQINIDCF